MYPAFASASQPVQRYEHDQGQYMADTNTMNTIDRVPDRVLGFSFMKESLWPGLSFYIK